MTQVYLEQSKAPLALPESPPGAKVHDIGPGGALFPKMEREKQNFCYLIIDPVVRHVTLWSGGAHRTRLPGSHRTLCVCFSFGGCISYSQAMAGKLEAS